MKVVVGYDGSDAAKRALDRALAVAGGDGQLTVVAAAETHVRTGITEGARLDPSEFERRRSDLEEAKQLLSERGVNGEAIAAQATRGPPSSRPPRTPTSSSWASAGSIRSSGSCSGR